MPVVFVHGATVRYNPDDPYDQYLAKALRRDDLFRRFALQSIVAIPENVAIFNPYWGDHGAKFYWNHASLLGTDHFGEDDEVIPQLLDAVLGNDLPMSNANVLAVARNSMEAAVDLLWSTLNTPPNSSVQNEVNTLAVQASDYAFHNPNPDWLTEVQNDEEFLSTFIEAVNDWQPVGNGESGNTGPLPKSVVSLRQPITWSKVKGGTARMNDLGRRLVSRGFTRPTRASLQRQLESLSPKPLPNAWLKIAEGTTRINNAGNHIVTRRLVRAHRASLHRQIALFCGDVFEYLNDRGTAMDPGPIIRAIIPDFEKAAEIARTSDDNILIVIAHSLGSIIAYDLLTYFRPDLHADIFVTVGSQVSLFEELKILKKRDLTVPANPATDRTPKPANIGRWLNIIDHCDVLGYPTSGVFDDTMDFSYSTGRGLIVSHVAYFEFPSFHRRLATWLKETRA